MEDLVSIFIRAIFIDNMVFAYFLGMCSYLAVSRTVNTSVGLGAAVVFVLGFTVPVNYLLESYILGRGALVAGATVCLCRSELSHLYHVYSHYCGNGAAGRNAY